jgi:hypothetical protein
MDCGGQDSVHDSRFFLIANSLVMYVGVRRNQNQGGEIESMTVLVYMYEGSRLDAYKRSAI